MKPIQSNSCKVEFGTSAYKSFLHLLEKNHYSKIIVLVDGNTEKYALNPFKERIEKRISFERIVIPFGEHHKNIDTCIKVWERLSKLGLDRKSLLINLGGGVVTDLGGFVACTYMRGIDYINIPTTLLSMVDASVGGKTGIDLGLLKNQIGIIRSPKMVLIDTQYLKTLAKEQMISGFAEMIKHTLISDKKKWEDIQKINPFSDSLERDIYGSIGIKNTVVLQDMEEKNLRKTLNYGHTLGHAIESCFLKSNPQSALLHGDCIAIGMVLASYLSTIYTEFSKDDCLAVKQYIKKIYQPVLFKKQDIELIIKLISSDKKNSYGKVNFVLLEEIGSPVIDIQVSDAHIFKAFEYYDK